MSITPILAVAATMAGAETEPVHDIGIAADVPTVTVMARAPSRTSVRLPSLTYALTLTIDCAASWQPDSVSVSVADSRASFVTEQLQTGGKLILELRIPANQLAPLRIEEFCIDDGNSDSGVADRDTITVPGVVSAQASLRCATESEQSIKYVTVPLDVVLECAATEDAANRKSQ